MKRKIRVSLSLAIVISMLISSFSALLEEYGRFGMKKFLSKVLIICILLSMVATAWIIPQRAFATTQSTYYVSTTGSDSNNGLTSTTAFQTIAKAQSVVRGVNTNMTGDIYVYIATGVYTQDSTLSFGSSDSGTNGYSIIYKAYTSGSVVLSGGQEITGWSLYDSAKNIYRATNVNFNFRELWVDGVRATVAKTTLPNLTRTDTGYTSTDPNLANLTNQSQIEFYYDVYAQPWTDRRVLVDNITSNSTSSTITMRSPSFYQGVNSHPLLIINQPTWVENSYSFLDEPGEWYLDRSAHSLYYKPLTGQNMSSVNVVAPKLSQIV